MSPPIMPPRIALLVAVLAVSWGSILARLCESGPLHISFYRVLLTALLAAPLVLIQGAGSPERRAVWPTAPRTLAMIAGAGLFLALHFATWIASLAHTTVGASVFLLSVQPVFGILLARVFLGESAGRRTVAGVALALAGTGIIAWGDLGGAGSGWLGDLLALAGAFFVAAYLLLARASRGRVAFGPWLVTVSASAALFLWILAGLMPGTDADAFGADRLWLLLMALGPGLTGHGLLNWTVRRLKVWVVNAALLGEPILATLFAWWIFGERPGLTLLAGGLLIAAGLIRVFLEEGRVRRAEGIPS